MFLKRIKLIKGNTNVTNNAVFNFNDEYIFFASANVTVYAASSLTNVMDDIVYAYQRQTGNKIRVSYAGSSSLARQIANGAPADIYLSANTKWMDYLVNQDQIEPNTNRDLLKK